MPEHVAIGTDATVSAEPAVEASGEAKQFVPPTSQEEFDRIITDRLNRQRQQFKDYDELKSKAAEFDAITEAAKSDLQKANEQLNRWQSDAEKWRNAAVSSTVKALAAGEFADPDDAVRNLDASKYLDAGGTINEDAIKADLAALLDAKPHYRRASDQTGPRVPRPNPAQGSSAEGSNPADPGQAFAGVMHSLLNRT